MTEVTVLAEPHRDSLWGSTLTGVDYRWDEKRGWVRWLSITGMWVPVKAGVVSDTVYARAGERFEERDSS